MRAPITFSIGLVVALLSLLQLITTEDPMRLIGLGVGILFIVWGWKVGWTRRRGLSLVLGHIALALGCLVTAYAIYQIPSLPMAPTLLEVLDLPLFWGLFTLWGGQCMITHGFCRCAIRSHEERPFNCTR
ncbi:MAG TPA: hypothetical protein P5550_05625 [Bacteroidales bacterium]|nr:hypothetical protein [Bacteroidales bacterium]HRZ76564.1 hypothetical protein [Bacteroidales bacterium]